jgi:hypothetical protein
LSVAQTLRRAKVLGLSLRADEGRIRYRPAHRAPDDFIALLKRDRTDLLRVLGQDTSPALEVVHHQEPETVKNHPLETQLRDDLVRGNHWLYKWHMENDAPPDTAPIFTKIFDEWYERNDAYRRLFQPEGCSLGDEGPCLIPAQCEVCY